MSLQSEQEDHQLTFSNVVIEYIVRYFVELYARVKLCEETEDVICFLGAEMKENEFVLETISSTEQSPQQAGRMHEAAPS